MTSYSPVPATQREFADLCVRMSKTSMVPATFRGRPDDIYVAAMWGAQLGLAPIAAVQNIAVINGKPSIYGDLAKAVCYRSGLMTSCVETVEGEGDAMTAICIVSRKGDPDKHEFRFSMRDAKVAGIASKAGPWKSYPKRMLQMRARGFALRDVFPDVLAGLITTEEAHDYPMPATAVAPASPNDLPVQDAVFVEPAPAIAVPDELKTRAEEAAKNGISAYQEFFLAIEKSDRILLAKSGLHSALKARAEETSHA